MARFAMPTNYVEQKNNSSYLNPSKMEEGTIKIRILSQPIVGWEEWHDKKPIRHHFDQKPDAPRDAEGDIKEFASMIVWNYNTKNIEILSYTQASIRKPILKYAADPDWGSLFEYDLKITKEGAGKDTEYSVSALPHSPLSQQIKAAFIEKPIRLDALFEGKDPFDNGNSRYTPLGIDEPDAVISKPAAKAAPRKEKAQVVIEATPEGANMPDDLIDYEYFMDFLPEHAMRGSVEEYVKLCSSASKLTPEAFMAKSLDNIANFMNYYDLWIEKRSARVSA